MSSAVDERLVKVIARFPAAPGDISAEGMWAAYDEARGLYQLKNTPWFAYGLSWGDWVSCQEDEDLEVVAVVEPSGHRTLRVYFDPSSPTEERERALNRVALDGVSFELANEELVALDVHPEADYAAVLAALTEEQEKDLLFFEEAWKGAEDAWAERDLPDWMWEDEDDDVSGGAEVGAA